MTKVNLVNQCTREKIEIDYNHLVRMAKIQLENVLSQFMSFNYKKFNWGCTSSYFYDYEFLNNELEFTLGNITIYYDLTKLISNVCNNCDDGVIISLKDVNLEGSGYSKFINSNVFKYFELSVYLQLENLFDKMARGCHELEMNMDDDFNTEISNDTIEDMYNVFVSELF